ncbi:MAG: FtsX-like permease family protein [Chloroflexi bacterium]|nr:FtsX-like permease family protein [Chloroflexota bacterium]
MFLLALRNLRARPARTIFTALAIALGVSLIFAMRIVGVAIDAAAREARQGRLAGADLEVVAANGADFDLLLADDLAARPEVAAVGPALRKAEGREVENGETALGQPAATPNIGLQLLGVDHERTLIQYELIAGEFFSGPDALEVIVPASWAAQNGAGVGETVSLTTADKTQEYIVVGLLKERNLLGERPTAWMPLETMQAAFDVPSAITTVYLRLKPGHNREEAREAIQTALGPQYIVVSVTDTARPTTSLENALQFASVVLLLSGAFLIYNAFAITLNERRREIGQLRALGMTRAQVLAQTLAEALVTALLGATAGLPVGYGMARLLILTSTDIKTLTTVPVPLDGVLLAVGAGLVVTVLVTLNLAREAGRVSPLAALKASERVQLKAPRRWGGIAALVLLAVYPIAHVLTLNAIREASNFNTAGALSFAPLALLAGATLFGLPAGINFALWLFERILRLSSLRAGGITRGAGVAAQLALGSLARTRSRATLTTATLTIGLMTIVALSGVTTSAAGILATQGDALDFMNHDFSLARIFNTEVAARAQAEAGGDTVASAPPLPVSLKTDLEALSAEAEMYSMGSVTLPGYMYLGWAAAADMDMFREATAFQPQMGSWAEADQYFASGPAVTLPEIIARRNNLKPGNTIEIETLKGKVPFKVALVGGAFPLVTRQVGEAYFNSHPAIFFMDAHPGVDKEALEARLRDLARKHDLALTVDSLTAFNTTLESTLGASIALFAGLTSLSGLVAGLGLITTLFASVLERQRELGTLRALGMSRAQVRGLVVLEAGFLGFAGSLMGAVSGLVMSLALTPLALAAYSALVGVTVKLKGAPPLPWPVALTGLVLGPGISMLAALYPADRAANVNPAEAMRAEGSTGFLKPAAHLGPTGLRGLAARAPRAAKLSFSLGLVFVLTMALTTYFRVNYERRLLEDNMRSILQRGFDVVGFSTRTQLPAEVAELTPQILADLQKQADVQVETLAAQQGDSPYEFTLRYVFIADTGNKVLLASDAAYNGRVLTETFAVSGAAVVVQLTDWTGERAFEAAVPIENKSGKRLGIARFGLSAEPVDNVIRDIIQSSLLTMAAALAIAVILTIVITRRALAPMTQIADASRAVARGDLARRVPETRWDDVGQMARAFNEMVSGLNERERMRDLFGRYLSREVSEAVLAGRVTLGGERKTITCLYVDMRGSTSFAEKYQPEEVMSALNGYFEVIILATEAHGGIVNRFVGDEAVCLFGAPTNLRDHAERAVQAALSMREGLAYLNHKRSTLNLPTLKFGIGLNTGDVVAGATGSEERQEYTVIGDAMNLGARIQALNKEFPAHDILLSEFTVTALGPGAERYNFVDLGPVEIRGKSQPVRVLGLVGRGGK